MQYPKVSHNSGSGIGSHKGALHTSTAESIAPSTIDTRSSVIANPVASAALAGSVPSALQRTMNCHVWKLAIPVTACPSATIAAK